jgi:hypothetical protein
MFVPLLEFSPTNRMVAYFCLFGVFSNKSDGSLFLPFCAFVGVFSNKSEGSLLEKTPTKAGKNLT